MNDPLSTNHHYSPFWAILVVFISLLALQAAYLVGDYNDGVQIARARAEIAPAYQQALKVNAITENLGKDLLALASANDTEAARIVAELAIKVNLPPK